SDKEGRHSAGSATRSQGSLGGFMSRCPLNVRTTYPHPANRANSAPALEPDSRRKFELNSKTIIGPEVSSWRAPSKTIVSAPSTSTFSSRTAGRPACSHTSSSETQGTTKLPLDTRNARSALVLLSDTKD